LSDLFHVIGRDTTLENHTTVVVVDLDSSKLIIAAVMQRLMDPGHRQFFRSWNPGQRLGAGSLNGEIER